MHSRHLIGLVLLLGTSVAMPMDLLKASGRPDELPSSLATACGLAVKGLQAEAAKRRWTLEVQCGLTPSSELDSSRTWRLRGPLPPLISGSARVSLESTDSSHHVVAVPVRLTVTSSVWKTIMAVPEDHPVQADWLTQTEFQWPVGVVPIEITNTPPSGRARRPLSVGDTVWPHHLISFDQAHRGGSVTLQLRQGPLSIERLGILMADARVGQTVRVQIKGQRDVVEGLLASPQMVVMDR